MTQCAIYHRFVFGTYMICISEELKPQYICSLGWARGIGASEGLISVSIAGVTRGRREMSEGAPFFGQRRIVYKRTRTLVKGTKTGTGKNKRHGTRTEKHNHNHNRIPRARVLLCFFAFPPRCLAVGFVGWEETLVSVWICQVQKRTRVKRRENERPHPPPLPPRPLVRWVWMS